jgi:hypothetical protein
MLRENVINEFSGHVAGKRGDKKAKAPRSSARPITLITYHSTPTAIYL